MIHYTKELLHNLLKILPFTRAIRAPGKTRLKCRHHQRSAVGVGTTAASPLLSANTQH